MTLAGDYLFLLNVSLPHKLFLAVLLYPHKPKLWWSHSLNVRESLRILWVWGESASSASRQTGRQVPVRDSQVFSWQVDRQAVWAGDRSLCFRGSEYHISDCGLMTNDFVPNDCTHPDTPIQQRAHTSTCGQIGVWWQLAPVCQSS